MIASLLHSSDYFKYIYLETIEETYGSRSACPHILRNSSLVQRNQEYLSATLGRTVDQISWHHTQRLEIYYDGFVTFRGTYKYRPLPSQLGKRGLFVEGALASGQEVESQDKTRKEKEV
jgi:hypothetical protein